MKQEPGNASSQESPGFSRGEEVNDDQKTTGMERTHIRALSDRLKDLAGWAGEALDDLIVRQVSRQSGQRPSGERPLEFNDRASELAAEVHGTLRAWAETVCATQPPPWPGEQRIPGWAKWLDRHLVDLARCEDAIVAFDELSDCHKRVLRAVDIPELPEFIGPCQSDVKDTTCEGVYCARGRVTFDCGTCGVAIDVPTVHAATAEALIGKLYTKKELRTALGILMNKPLPPSTLDSWIKRGRLNPRPNGKFALSEALMLLKVS